MMSNTIWKYEICDSSGYCVNAQNDNNPYHTYPGYKLTNGITFLAMGTMQEINDSIHKKECIYWSCDSEYTYLYCQFDCIFEKSEGANTFNVY